MKKEQRWHTSARLAGIALACPVMFGFLMARSQQSSPGSGNPAAAIYVLRIVNTAEMNYRTRYGVFAAHGDLARSQLLDTVKAQMTHPLVKSPFEVGRWEQPIPGFTFDVWVSQDGSHYLAALRNEGEDPCLPSFFSDEKGVILQASAIGCPPK
jgi:hypothetical protein